MTTAIRFLTAGIRHRVRTGCACAKWSGTATGNQNPVRVPNPVVVDPLPEDIRIETTTTPATYREGRVGKRIKFETHHIEPIDQGGGVYDVDNMGVTTPRQHINIHSNK